MGEYDDDVYNDDVVYDDGVYGDVYDDDNDDVVYDDDVYDDETMMLSMTMMTKVMICGNWMMLCGNQHYLDLVFFAFEFIVRIFCVYKVCI